MKTIFVYRVNLHVQIVMVVVDMIVLNVNYQEYLKMEQHAEPVVNIMVWKMILKQEKINKWYVEKFAEMVLQ